MTRILLTARWPQAVEAELVRRFEVAFNPDDHPFSREELKQALQNYEIVCPTVVDPLDREVLSVEPLRCRLLANFGVGVNHIDLETARKRGITVTNTPGVLTDCTADLAMTLLLMTARRAGEGERQVRSGRWRGWRPTHLLGTKVTGKTLGIVGMGRIGRAVARRARHGFGMRILYVHPRPLAPEDLAGLDAQACDSLEAMLPQCDFVSLHCPGGAKNYHLLDRARLSRMKPGSFLVNTARGDVVDTDALIAALDHGPLRGAGLDVYENEPNIDPRLLAREDVVLLPHLGSATRETREAMGRRVLANLEAFLAGREPPDRVV
ncbi:glyoxylate reductase [Methylomarinovum caldicuralii]|uniref:Glyoxylate reductase n=1 Tax=Methylomarinovum caldicuralii TaxID=438856 RepID=A0AAU9C8V4_9GAMM|nr:D-glycerate dehydrogenase [Methylomarinovum caldicuralii]BCX80899.1 glyoxylate reductase [Methylomarinovum caldicuralii]